MKTFRVIPVYYEAGEWFGSRKIEWVWGSDLGIPHPDPVRGWIIRWEPLHKIRLFTTGEIIEIDPQTNRSLDNKFWIGDPFAPQQIPIYRTIEIQGLMGVPEPMPRPDRPPH